MSESMNSATYSPRSARVTISLPQELFCWIERERGIRGIGRSEFLTEVTREYMANKEFEHRVERYREAYRKMPLTEWEAALADWSAELLWEEEDK